VKQTYESCIDFTVAMDPMALKVPSGKEGNVKYQPHEHSLRVRSR